MWKMIRRLWNAWKLRRVKFGTDCEQCGIPMEVTATGTNEYCPLCCLYANERSPLYPAKYRTALGGLSLKAIGGAVKKTGGALTGTGLPAATVLGAIGAAIIAQQHLRRK